MKHELKSIRIDCIHRDYDQEQIKNILTLISMILGVDQDDIVFEYNVESKLNKNESY